MRDTRGAHIRVSAKKPSDYKKGAVKNIYHCPFLTDPVLSSLDQLGQRTPCTCTIAVGLPDCREPFA